MHDPCACSDFNRAELLRAGAARAGRGLPAIEPGMPQPAGTGLDRRSFLMRGAGLALSVYGASRLGVEAFEAGVAQAAGGPADPVLVSVFLPGGWDSLSVLAPVGDARYATLRPTLKLAPGSGTTFAEDTRLMWHPAAAGLATLHAEGKVSVFPAVGYDHPDQSHFTSRHFWEVGATDTGASSGWMGRYLDVVGDPDNPLQGMALDASLAPALATTRVPVAAISDPTDYSFPARGVGDPIADPMLAAFGRMGAIPGGSDALAQARAAVRQTDGVRRSVAGFVTADGSPSYTSPVTYPTAGGDLPLRLAALAAMLAGGLPIRCVAVEGVGSYDTHTGQATSLATNLGQTVAAVLAFQRDLEARGLADRVLIQLWSEFGRRPQENGSGTDHGAGGCAFVIGTQAKGTMVGEFPGLATLDAQSNLRATSDFRAMYCSLLEQWLGVDAEQVIPGAASFARPVLVR
ncbi:DUF1501 domain-containing protein [Baekduia soli]|uniref:DUF1501 domain-containing protein n=1 Tax=Baekduia soli TaxID=496014 RepID=A0A5B8U6F9_9ACTN|nr:DUF1501 domain-containing protein [Baekduia soli]QEC48521.1 DUF1501 domain-containing protein [Baekduia soli]